MELKLKNWIWSRWLILRSYRCEPSLNRHNFWQTISLLISHSPSHLVFFVWNLSRASKMIRKMERKKLIWREEAHLTYRVSSSRSSLTFSVLATSSSSSSELIASANRAFNGIKSVDWKRLEKEKSVRWAGKEKEDVVWGCIFCDLQLVLVHGILGQLQSHAAHLSLAHAVKAIIITNDRLSEISWSGL